MYVLMDYSLVCLFNVEIKIIRICKAMCLTGHSEHRLMEVTFGNQLGSSVPLLDVSPFLLLIYFEC